MPGRNQNSNLPKYSWVLREKDPRSAKQKASGFASQIGTTDILARLLLARGIDTPQRARAYLKPGLNQLLAPDAIPGLIKARDRLLKAAKDKEQVMVHGDYDADGISGTVILHSVIKDLGCQSRIYLPKRDFNGFGLAAEAASKAVSAGINLLVSVDCGVSSHETVRMARDAGLEVIITDHHAIPERLPDANIIVHPELDGEYPGGNICGAMVAFKLAQALVEATGGNVDAFRNRYLPLAALATVADVCPLTGENRSIVALGMVGIPKSDIPGLRILCEGSRRQGVAEPINARDIAFGMAPLMNAAGRMGDPFPAARLLTAQDDDTAWKYFRALERLNRDRKRIQSEVCRRLASLPEVAWGDGGTGILALVDHDCMPGLAGLAASRLAEQTGRPTCILAPGKDETGILYRGSMRTSGGENLIELMGPTRESAEKIGGHPGAIGLTVRPEKLDEFLGCCRELSWSPKTPELELDFVVDEVPDDPDRVVELAATGPWGAGNPEPGFVWEDVTIKGTRAVGKGLEHIQLMLQGSDGTITKSIGFSMAEHFGDEGILGRSARAAGQFILNTWQGVTSVEFRLEDIELY